MLEAEQSWSRAKLMESRLRKFRTFVGNNQLEAPGNMISGSGILYPLGLSVNHQIRWKQVRYSLGTHIHTTNRTIQTGHGQRARQARHFSGIELGIKKSRAA